MVKRMFRVFRSPRAVLRSVLNLDGSAHSIALGTAIGVGIGMTPTVGIQMVIVVAVAAIMHPFCRFNRAAALASVYVSNPLTVLPLYWCLYRLGTCFVEGSKTSDDLSKLLSFQGFGGWWQAIQSLVFEFGAPLAVGTLIVAPVTGLITYPIMRMLIRWYRGPSRAPAAPSEPPVLRLPPPETTRRTAVPARKKTQKLTLTES